MRRSPRTWTRFIASTGISAVPAWRATASLGVALRRPHRPQRLPARGRPAGPGRPALSAGRRTAGNAPSRSSGASCSSASRPTACRCWPATTANGRWFRGSFESFKTRTSPGFGRPAAFTPCRTTTSPCRCRPGPTPAGTTRFARPPAIRWRRFPDAELLILGLRLRYRMSQRDVAHLLGVHEGTISRQTDKLARSLSDRDPRPAAGPGLDRRRPDANSS